MDVGCLEKHNFAIVLLEKKQKHYTMVWFFVNSHKASPHSLVSGLAVIRPIAVLNGFKVVIQFSATTKLIVTTSN